MFNLDKKTIQKKSGLIGRGFKGLAWAIGNNAFLFIIIFIVVDILIGEFLFYHYIVSPQSYNSPANRSLVKFQSQTYQSVLNDWKTRSDAFDNAGKTIYNDLFQ
jgi:hypothetical protein